MRPSARQARQQPVTLRETPPTRPRHTLIPRPEAAADVLALATHGPDVVAAAMAITDDLASAREALEGIADQVRRICTQRNGELSP